MHIDTQIARSQGDPDNPLRPTAVPIYQTATFSVEDVEHGDCFHYSRSGNPTRAALERQIAELEGGGQGFAFATGIAAVAAAMRVLRPGDEVLTHRDLYGGSYRLLARILEPRGVGFRWCDQTDLASVEAAVTSRTKLIWAESLSNPRLEVVDLRGLARIARERGARLAVDATTMTPYLQRPLELGADIVVHSGTKALNGHSDVTAGLVVVRDERLAAELRLIHNGEGAVLGPFDSYLLLRGMKTLAVRLDRQQRSALEVARRLEELGSLTQVIYPGLDSHPGAVLHATQSSGAGTVIGVRTGSIERSKRLVRGLKLFSIGYSFGSVTSSVALPATMSHATLPAELKRAAGFPEDIVRISIGLEHAEDLLRDLEEAIAGSASG
jgi:cysteine-S-conjugate beta-lyase